MAATGWFPICISTPRETARKWNALMFPNSILSSNQWILQIALQSFVLLTIIIMARRGSSATCKSGLSPSIDSMQCSALQSHGQVEVKLRQLHGHHRSCAVSQMASRMQKLALMERTCEAGVLKVGDGGVEPPADCFHVRHGLIQQTVGPQHLSDLVLTEVTGHKLPPGRQVHAVDIGEPYRRGCAG